MGGNAFASEGLHTPRMSPQIYYHVLNEVLTKLRTVVSHAESPIPGPAKKDYGDVDVMIVVPVKPDASQSHDYNPTNEQIAELLGAKYFKSAKRTSAHFALPWPLQFDESLTSQAPSLTTTQSTSTSLEQDMSQVSISSTELPLPQRSPQSANIPPSTSSTSEKYIQLDLSRHQSPSDLHRELFAHAHGDMWSMIGNMVRPFGLKCTDKGIYIRIPELETTTSKTSSQFLLTDDPDGILRYLELDVERFRTPFKTWDECMAYATTCRFYVPGGWQKEYTAELAQEGETVIGNGQPKKFNKHDRTHMRNRPLFIYWLKEYLPAHTDDKPGRSSTLTREETIEDAKTWFGPEFARRFDRHRREEVLKMETDRMWADIRKSVTFQINQKEVGGGEAEGMEKGEEEKKSTLTYVMKGLRREIGGGNEMSSGPRVDVSDVQQSFIDHKFDIVKDWAVANWSIVAERQKAFDREQSRANLLDKLDREKN